jgi:hypothetical protein
VISSRASSSASQERCRAMALTVSATSGRRRSKYWGRLNVGSWGMRGLE